MAAPGAAWSSGLHVFSAVAVAPVGGHVATVEHDTNAGDAAPLAFLIIRTTGGNGPARPVRVPCGAGPDCVVSSPTWSADGTTLAFLVARQQGLVGEIYTVGAGGGAARLVARFPGPLDGLRYGPHDRLAVLATANAHKAVGRTQAGAPMTGEIGAEVDEQRIAVLDGGALRFVSPPDLYVYEYDWRPDGGFVGTAAHGDGDSNWWVAKLYAFDPTGAARVLFSPPGREQLASPTVSPDGAAVAFIGGWMSDFGSTGGDAFVLPLSKEGAGAPRNLTPNLPATVTALRYGCGPGLIAVTLGGDTVALRRLDQISAPPLWQGTDSLSAGGWNLSVSCGGDTVAAIRQSFTAPPELAAATVSDERIADWRLLTDVNRSLSAPLAARSLAWRDDAVSVQGWLLTAKDAGSARRPLIELVHGGPEAAATPQFPPLDSPVRAFLAQGWDVFEPNYRGSFGQGEAFAAASIQDLGGGDWRDVLSGVAAAERAAPIDDAKVGITGWSYGGYMTMWAVTQTHRYRAGAAGAGVSDWLSIEGEAPQAGSDAVNFGGSVYDNAAPYLKASPVMHMRGVVTPVLIGVGERDLECPMPQSEEFATAMKAVGAPSDFIVYAGEGHGFHKQADRADWQRRTIAWFHRWFDGGAHG
jgi:dipeptidyl aminopeptidase/acylaminoacyl peptidase